jgi:hypothetical protein
LNLYVQIVDTKNDIFRLDLDELIEKAEEEKELNSVCYSIVKEANASVLDEYQLKKNEDWSVIAYQVVGSESM